MDATTADDASAHALRPADRLPQSSARQSGKLSPTRKVRPECAIARASDHHGRRFGLDLVKAVEPPATAAGTVAACLGPVLGCAEVRPPKRPHAALPRPVFVHGALPRLALEKNAVAVPSFDKALSDANSPHVPHLERLHVEAQLLRHTGDLSPIHPYEARCTGAAVAAASALESQAVLVPGLAVAVAILRGGSCHRWSLESQAVARSVDCR